jgi:hypothetical protein
MFTLFSHACLTGLHHLCGEKFFQPICCNHIELSITYLFIYIYIYKYTHTYIYISIHIFTHTYPSIHPYTHPYKHTHNHNHIYNHYQGSTMHGYTLLEFEILWSCSYRCVSCLRLNCCINALNCCVHY